MQQEERANHSKELGHKNLYFDGSRVKMSVQKRRNFTRQTGLLTNHHTDHHHVGAYFLKPQASYLREKTVHKNPMHNTLSYDNILHESLFANSMNRQFSALEVKFNSFSAQIKQLSRGEGTLGKENVINRQNMSIAYIEKPHYSSIRRTEVIDKDEKEKISNHQPYFIQCLKRKTIIVNEVSKHIHNSMITFKQHIRSIKHCKAKLPDPNIPASIDNRKTIVFDMDETLIHTHDFKVKDYEIKVPFKTIHNRVINGYVSVRPYAKEIIKNMSRFFDVIIFTAANQCYADPILDYLDPQKNIKYRLYRQSCSCINNQLFVKDLRVLGRPLQRVVLVDNAPHSYLLQMKNGIPILNYIKGKEDDQLIQLQPYLMSLLDVEDVREVNSNTFRLEDYHRYDSEKKLICDLYAKWL